jgi:MoaA/NifB/PqqE/SkfB family radical SAM enzyme
MKKSINNFQIELVEGCTRRCDFCGINQIKDKCTPPNFMSVSLAEYIAAQISRDFKERIRIEFAVHGEPLLNPDIVEIIRLFRYYLPKSQLSIISNGDPLLMDKSWELNDLFEAGLNFLMVDFYDHNEDRNSRLFDVIEKTGIDDIKDFYEDDVHIWGYKSSKIKEIIIVPPLAEKSGDKAIRKIHTAGGNLPLEVWDKYSIDKGKLPKLTRCAKPFREMTINWKGNVSVCCEDWKQEHVIDNVVDKDIVDIWNSEKMNQYRYILYHKRRDLIPLCELCNQMSFRVGFLKVEEEYPELIPSKEGNE